MRTVTLMNSLGPGFEHLVAPIDGETSASSTVREDVSLELLEAPPKSVTASVPGFRRLLRSRRPDLLLTYNWGAIDAVLAARLSGVCPVIHGEDGFGPDEAESLKTRRVIARRLLLRGAFTTVVPSRTLYEVARRRYRLPAARVRHLPNGVDCRRFRPGAAEELRQELGAPSGGLLFGFVGALRGEKNLPLLLEAFARAAIPSSRLVLLGSGPLEPELRRITAALGLGEQVVFAGSAVDPAPYYRAFDVFVLTSSTEQMPVSLLEAMAAGLPAVCTDVGDCAEMLDQRSSPFVVPPGDADACADALRAMTDRGLREDAGARNRERCLSRYSLEDMVAAYRKLYEEAAGRQ